MISLLSQYVAPETLGWICFLPEKSRSGDLRLPRGKVDVAEEGITTTSDSSFLGLPGGNVDVAEGITTTSSSSFSIVVGLDRDPVSSAAFGCCGGEEAELELVRELKIMSFYLWSQLVKLIQEQTMFCFLLQFDHNIGLMDVFAWFARRHFFMCFFFVPKDVFLFFSPIVGVDKRSIGAHFLFPPLRLSQNHLANLRHQL